MKLAEALQERADLKRKIEQLKVRMQNNALIQEGEEPSEDPAELLKELDSSVDRLQELTTAINMKNCETVVNGKTVTELIAEKDCLKIKYDSYCRLVDAASRKINRYSNTEIKVISAVDVKSLQKKADETAKQLRLTDNAIQACNWTAEI